MKTVTRTAFLDKPHKDLLLQQQLLDSGCQLLQVSEKNLKDTLGSGKMTIMLIDMDDDAQVNQMLIDYCLQQHLPIIRIYPETAEVSSILDTLNHGDGDCLQRPLNKSSIAIAIERCLNVSRLVDLTHIQRQRMEKSLSKLKSSIQTLELDQVAGRQMQRALLPKSPTKIGDYVAERLMVPSLYLSGDFVNYQPALERYFLFFLTDVSGHGSASAFVTIMLKQLMARLVAKQSRNRDYKKLSLAPLGFLERFNKDIIQNNLEKHLTVFAGSIDTETNRLRYVIGAHLPLPILVSDGKAIMLKGKGLPVGIYEDISWQVEEIQLPESFVLYCFSDGILEVLPGENMHEKEQLLLQKLPSCSPHVNSVLAHFGVILDKEPPDDVAILMIKRGVQ